jgi:hypothetical protein
MAKNTVKQTGSLSLERLKAKIAKRNAKVLTNSKQRRLVLAKVMKA